MKELLLALQDVLKRAELFSGHAIRREALSVRQRMGDILAHLEGGKFHPFTALFTAEEGKLGVLVTFLAILELAKEQLLDIVQEASLGPIDNPGHPSHQRSAATLQRLRQQPLNRCPP